MAVTDMGAFLEATLTQANPSENFNNSAGSLEIAGNFAGPATVTANLTGGSIAVDTFTVAETTFAKASALTFGVTGANGSTSITIRWWKDRSLVQP